MCNPKPGDLVRIQVVDLQHAPGEVMHEYTLLVLDKHDRDITDTTDYWRCMVLDDYLELVGKIILTTTNKITNGSVWAQAWSGYEERSTTLWDD